VDYKGRYRALPASAQKAVRELLNLLSDCKTEPVMVGGTACQSQLEVAVVKVQLLIQDIKDRNKREPR
jgi:hypothetical protein